MTVRAASALATLKGRSCNFCRAAGAAPGAFTSRTEPSGLVKLVCFAELEALKEIAAKSKSAKKNEKRKAKKAQDPADTIARQLLGTRYFVPE